VVTIDTVLLASLIAAFTAVALTVVIVLLVVIYNNTKLMKEKEDDGMFTLPYSNYSGGGNSGGTSLTIGDLIRMQQAAQAQREAEAAKEKSTTKADLGGGQYI